FRSLCRQPPARPSTSLLHATPQLVESPAFAGLGFALRQQARRCRPAESSSLSYGWIVHLLLLPTSPRGDAVAVGYRPESVCLERTFTSLIMCAFRRTADRLSSPSAPRMGMNEFSNGKFLQSSDLRRVTDGQ